MTRLALDIPWAMPLAQHTPAVLSRFYAERLDRACTLEVVETYPVTVLEPGSSDVAKGCADMVQVQRAGQLTVLPKLENTAHLWHPSVEHLGREVLEHCDPVRVTGVMLTGMGSDGVLGHRSAQRSPADHCRPDPITGCRTIASGTEANSACLGGPGRDAQTFCTTQRTGRCRTEVRTVLFQTL